MTDNLSLTFKVMNIDPNDSEKALGQAFRALNQCNSGSWLTKEEALRRAINYRMRGDETTLPILYTDFDVKNLRVMEVQPGVWDDPTTWIVTERPMTDGEFAGLNHFMSDPGQQKYEAIGKIVTAYDGEPVRVQGYVSRPKIMSDELHREWKATLDIDWVKARVYAMKGEVPPEDDFERFVSEHAKIKKP